MIKEINPYIFVEISQGTEMRCPLCYSFGKKDDMLINDNEAEFGDAIWWNNYENHWECWDCWLK